MTTCAQSLAARQHAARRARAAARRAATDDLPLPDGPTMPSSGAPTSRATSSATSRSRPKKYGASATSKDARPLNGHTTGRRATAGACRLVRSSDDLVGELGLDRPQLGAPGRGVRGRQLDAAGSLSRTAHSRASSCTCAGLPRLSSNSRRKGGSTELARGTYARGDGRDGVLVQRPERKDGVDRPAVKDVFSVTNKIVSTGTF